MSVPPTTAHPLTREPGFPALKEHVIAATGLAYYSDKEDDLAERVARRLSERGVRDCAGYLALLRDGRPGEEELDALIEDLTIGETFFFRHREVFDALRDVVVPDLVARQPERRRLRVWSAGCATGAEPYSVSILCKRELAARLAGWEVTIVGTDINRHFLARAHEGRYEEWALRNTPEEVRRACFTRVGNSWALAPEFRQGVSFQYHNLVTHPFPSLVNDLYSFDLILCRNVTIYFSGEIVRRILDHFHQCLADDGWLLVGHAEPNTELFRAFRTVNAAGCVLYQKTAQPGTFADAQAAPFPAPWLSVAGGVQAWQPPVLPENWPAPVAPRQESAPVIPDGLAAIRALADRGEWAEAERRCEELLQRDRLNPGVYFYQALVHEQRGGHAESESALRRALYLDRNFVLAHYYLGLLLQKQEQRPQAVRSFRNVLQLLERTAADHVFADGDGLTAAELKKLTQTHLRVLEEV